MTWRTAALVVCWLAAGGWGIYYLAALGTTSLVYIVYAVLHFLIGSFWARAIMSRPLMPFTAILGLFGAGAFTRLAIGAGTAEVYFAPLGIVAAIVLADTATLRTTLLSVLSFALGALAFLWLTP